MQIYVKVPTGATHSLSVSGNDTGLELKQKIEERYRAWGIDPPYTLVIDGTYLHIKNTRKLSEQGASKGVTLVADKKRLLIYGESMMEHSCLDSRCMHMMGHLSTTDPDYLRFLN
jgi:hypothetical protein